MPLVQLTTAEQIAEALMAGYAAVSLRCEGCGHTEVLDVPTLARYLGDGWPICCGETTLLVLERAHAD